MLASLFILTALAALDLRAITVWASAHPYEAFIALGVVLNVLNGLLPATIRTGPLGTALHVALDRVTILTRRNAPGTLKWPIIAGSILRAVADSLNPPEVPAGIALPAEKQGALSVSETREPEPPHPTPADGVAFDAQRRTLGAVTFDPRERQSIVAPPRDDGQRGSVDVRGLLAVVVALSVVLPLGVALYGCPASRQLTRPALGAVDGCEPRSTRCSPTGRPQVCSGSRRWTDADNVCALGVNVSAVCCLTRSPVTGAELHACVLAERCLPVDGGTR